MKLNRYGASFVVAIAARFPLLFSPTAIVAVTGEAVAVEAAESVGLLCPAEAPCDLAMGIAFGDPWVKAEAGVVGYFQVNGTPQIQPSEIIVTLAHGDVETFARSGGQLPTQDEFGWRGGRVLRLPGWSIPHGGDSLILMVNATSDARYRVLAASDEDVLRLEDGLPVQMLQYKSEMRYFSIAVKDNATDLLLSLDAQSGDPDMYVSPQDPLGRFLPTRENFTWQALSFGTDTLHMQAESLGEHCNPDVDANKACTYNIGVLANTNCSYTIKASLKSGWKQPQQLLLGQPQSSFLEEGTFDYYALVITKAPNDDPWESVVVTATPTDGGQQDLYATANRTREPGPKDYDIKSTNWAGSSTMVFSETAPGFCTDCIIYVGVYGYKKGGYSIVASQGLTRLHEGFPQQGTVWGDEQRYYEFYNPFWNRQPIEVAATALTGDPDLYVSVGGSDLPGPQNFDWMGGATGSDVVEILPTDDLFCTDCAYQIGIKSASRSAFTVSVSRGGSGATVLVHGRPQAAKVAAGGMRLFLVRPDSDIERMTLTLTKSVGDADLYMVRTNGTATTLINPLDDRTYSWTSKGLAEDTISVQGVEGGTTDPYLIGVAGVTSAFFTVVASFSQSISILQAGVPQRHTLEAGKTITFGFLVDQEDQDLQLTVTPVQGNPDLYASMGATPSCTAPDKDGNEADGDGVSGSGKQEGEESAGGVVCSGWTWASTGRRRSILISSVHPCDLSQPQNVVDATDDDYDGDDGGGFPLVSVSDDCVATSFGVGMMFMTVAAQGGLFASFAVMASVVGKHVSLVTGMPQHVVTSPMVPCGSATQTKSGPCSAQYETSNVMQEALFTFRVEAGSPTAATGFSLDLRPECPSGSCGGATCPAGCPERPARVYVKSCLEGLCHAGDRFPSQGNADKEFEVSSAQSSVFIADATGLVGDSDFCRLSKGTKGTCVFYIAVTGGGPDDPPMQLTATADVISGVSVVVPCVGDESLPDGVIVTPTNRVPPSGVKRYELCAKRGVDFQVSVESCRGRAQLFVGDTPLTQDGESEYMYMASGNEVCTKFPPPRGTGKNQCSAPAAGGIQDEVSVIVKASDLPDGAPTGSGANGAMYFVGVGTRPGQRAQDQEYVLRLNLIGEGGVPISPMLAAKPLPAAVPQGVASRAVVGNGEATVEWGGATLHTPKFSGLHAHEAEDRDCGLFCSFEVFAVPTRLREEFARTPCGLESIRIRHNTDVAYSFVGAARVPGEVMRVTLEGLRYEEHDVFVLATCDFMCLEALLRMQCSRVLGSISSPCKTQRVMFPAAQLVPSTSSLTPTSGSPAGGGGRSSSSSSSPSSSGTMSQSPVLLIAALLAVVVGIAYALQRQHRFAAAGGGDYGGNGIIHSYAPANTATGGRSSGGGGWGWGWFGNGGGGGGSGFTVRAGAGTGFELTDLQAQDQQKKGSHRGDGSGGGGGDGLSEFLVGGSGRRGRDAESGPAYASLLAGEERS